MVEVKNEHETSDGLVIDHNENEVGDLEDEAAKEIQGETHSVQGKECSIEPLDDSHCSEDGKSNAWAANEVQVVGTYYPNMGLWDILRAQRALKRDQILKERALQNM